jgi:hypothetical protein
MSNQSRHRRLDRLAPQSLHHQEGLAFSAAMEVGTRRIAHWNLTTHPNGDWTAQQFRMIVSGEQRHRYVIHDRDSIYSEVVDRTL